METAILNVRLPKADLTFLEHYTQQHQLSLSELLDDYIRTLRQTESAHELSPGDQGLAQQMQGQSAIKQHSMKTIKSRNIEEFLEKWTGFLEGVDLETAKFEYLQEKYQ